jgi:hypothetical protein
LPAEASVLLVGDRTKIEADLRSLLGEVIVVDAEGRPLPKTQP